MSYLKRLREVLDSVLTVIWGDEPKRARAAKGRYKADDKSTPNVNEAWKGGKAPKRKKAGRPKGSKNKKAKK